MENSNPQIKTGMPTSFWTTLSNKELAITELRMNDGPSGVRATHSAELFVADAAKSHCYPSPSTLSQSFDKELVFEVGQAIALEAIQHGFNVLLAPGVNLKLNPRAGRNFEYFSEDVTLTSALASQFINGVQSVGVAACVKHYVCNEFETDRMLVDVLVDDNTLFNDHLRVFRNVIREANPWTLMVAYNSVNGEKLAESRYFLVDLLRDLLGYDGVTISDWGAVFNSVASFAAGLDIEMPLTPLTDPEGIAAAVEEGLISEDTVVSRLERLRLLSDRLAAPTQSKTRLENVEGLAMKAATNSITLLKNDNALLPHSAGRVGVVETENLAYFRIQGRGSSEVNPLVHQDLKKELRVELPSAVFESDFSSREEFLSQVDTLLVVVGLSDLEESEGYDRSAVGLSDEYLELLESLSQSDKKLIVVNNSGSAVYLGDVSRYCAIFHTGLPGEMGPRALAQILSGKVNPSGRLSESFPNSPRANDEVIKISAGQIMHTQGRASGYRNVHAAKNEAFSFGHGMSYSPLDVAGSRWDQDGGDVLFHYEVTNTSDRSASCVVQIYATDLTSSYLQPPRELIEFKKSLVEPGSTNTLKIRITPAQLERYLPATRSYELSNGKFRLTAGLSSSQTIDSVTVSTKASSETLVEIANSFDGLNSINELMEIDFAYQAAQESCPKIFEPTNREILGQMPLKVVSALFPDIVSSDMLDKLFASLKTAAEAVRNSRSYPASLEIEGS